MPAISVIVPVYNTEKYLRRCVDSILAQSFGDFELILVDDGSPDNCGGICDEYATKDSRVQVIHKENSGVSASRNVGIERATGDYILFCDSDDYVSPFWAEELFKAIKAFPEAFIACRAKKFIDGDTASLDNKQVPEMPHEVTYFDLFKLGLSAYSCNKIYERDKLLSLNLRFDETVFLSEDVKFNAAFCMACDKVVLIEQELYYYRQLDSSATGRYHPDLLTLDYLPFKCRLPLICDSELQQYCDIWFYIFYHLLDNVFDPRNTEMSFWERIQYNQRAIEDETFQFCMSHADLKQDNPILIFLLKNKKYYLFRMAQKAAELKRNIKRKATGEGKN